MRHLRLALEDRAQELRQARVELDDLLELVDDEGRSAAARPSELGGQLEQALERCVDIGPRPPELEGEGERRRPRD